MWSVAQTKPGQLDLALTNLARQGFRAFCPVFEKRKHDRRRKLVTVSEPLFINYVFIALAEGQRWTPISYTFGVNRLLTRQATDSEYLEPATIPDSFIAGLKSYSTETDTHQWRLDPGTIVKIERGPFAQMTGTITAWSSAERCRCGCSGARPRSRCAGRTSARLTLGITRNNAPQGRAGRR